uniref:FAD-binding oxidoreductase n=1 Tax=Stieleria sp. TaxID=2795976 RepID=UPI003569BE9F
MSEIPKSFTEAAVGTGSSSSPIVSPAGSANRPADLLETLAQIVGAENLLHEDCDRDLYAKTTLPQGTRPLAIIRPENADQVSNAMRAITAAAVQWKAISRGKNWGYGDACAAEDGAIIIDLRRMDRIIEINEDLAYAVIEPGVTQGQLAGELIARGSRLMLDVTGAGPEASIAGNILQRGFGHTPYGDRFANSCNYEVVLPDGNVTRTGFGNIENSVVGHVYPYGRGPNPQGMLPQSSNGIVTRMTIWLMPRPEAIDGFGFKTDDDEAFKHIVDTIGRLRQEGVIDSVVHLANDLRVLSSQPALRSTGERRAPLTPAERKAMRKQAGVGRWNGLGGLYGPRTVVNAKRRVIKQALRKYCRVRFFTQRQVKLLDATTSRMPTSGPFGRLKNLSSAIKDVNDLLCGVPTATHLEGAFFRNRPDSGEVIDAGLIWIAPVIPCTGDDALRLIEHLEPIANQHGFDLPITISPVVPRAAVCIANISFDSSDPAESLRATDCYAA